MLFGPYLCNRSSQSETVKNFKDLMKANFICNIFLHVLHFVMLRCVTFVFLKMFRTVMLMFCDIYALWQFSLCDVVHFVMLMFCNSYVLWLLRCVQLHLVTVTLCDIYITWGYILLRHHYMKGRGPYERVPTEAEFLDVIGTKASRVFLISIHSHLY